MKNKVDLKIYTFESHHYWTRYGRKTRETILRKRWSFANFFIWRDKSDLFEAFDRKKSWVLKKIDIRALLSAWRRKNDLGQKSNFLTKIARTDLFEPLDSLEKNKLIFKKINQLTIERVMTLTFDLEVWPHNKIWGKTSPTTSFWHHDNSYHG